MSITSAQFHGSRLTIGLAVADVWRSLYEIAKLEGKTSGAIRGVIRRMLADGLLEADSEPPTRGTLYRVPPDALDALLEAAQGLQEPGVLTQHQRLLSVRGGPGRIEAMDLLASTEISGAISWVARTNSVDDLLVAMNPEAEDDLVDALVRALEERGFKCREGLVAQIMSGTDLRNHSKRVSGRAKGLQ
jgi:hypothetical protein